MNEINAFYNSNITADIDTTQIQNCKPDLDKIVGRYIGRCIHRIPKIL